LLKNVLHPVISFILVVASAGASAASVPDVLPAALAWTGKSERLIVPAGERWSTPAEKAEFRASPSYADTLAYLRELDDASGMISLHTFGKSYQARDLVYVHARKPGSGKPVVVVQAGIHAGEIDGKDAGLMLLRDIAVRGRDDLLDKVDLVYIPILNVDAHENASALGRPHQRGPHMKGSRTSAQGLDLNRDYARLQSPEIAAVVKLLQRFDPALYVDLHVSDGIDYQYDVTYAFPGWGTYARSRATADWLMTTFTRDVDAALAAQGHVPAVYPSWVDENSPERGLRISAEGPRYSTGYGDFVGIPTVLVENHTMKPYKRRVLGTYVFLEQSLATVGREGARIAQAKARDRAARPDKLMVRWERESAPLAATQFKGVRYASYESPASGARELRWTGEPATFAMPVFGVRSTKDVNLPGAWWIGAQDQDLIAALRAHGIRMEVLDAPRTVTLEAVQMASGRERAGMRRVLKEVTMPAGSVRIARDQPFHLLAAALLEPDSDDSFLAHGRFDAALPLESRMARHLLAPMADRMMEASPELRLQFQAALAQDAALAADPQARLRWWLARSPYLDLALWTYPVYAEPR